MNHQRLYGQHFLISEKIAQRIVQTARILNNDTIFEAGTGHGILTRIMAPLARHVISVESDPTLYGDAQSTLDKYDNITLLYGDAFEDYHTFNVFVSNLPYSHSRRAVEWMTSITFRSGVMMVQKEFAQKLTETGKTRRAISVIWQEAFRIREQFDVGPHNFNPSPKVDSVVIYFEKTRTISKDVIHRIHRLFSSRRRLVAGTHRRLDDMTSHEILNHVI
ncbi:MAG: ribose ABC transporter permease [Cenarchaeum sp. SB0678_bin_8]|nr:ribose ABC transporter permease [Cenarchaeum sp. SB0678_bin_8]MYJ28219.1 ribose ABC transporter permease [Cenarchaeum sp. SB0672_bin_9]